MSQNLQYNKINKNNGRPQMPCPHCQATTLRIRSSQQNHPLLKKIWLQCPNLMCGFTCGGHIEITHTISPSAMPNPSIHLPTLKELMEHKAANDEENE